MTTARRASFVSPALLHSRVSKFHGSVCSRRTIATPEVFKQRHRCTQNSSFPRTSPSSSTALIIVDHGSKRDAANEQIFQIAGALQTKVDVPVHAAHMELASPSIEDAVKACVEGGASNIIVVPYFLSPGRHVTSDIPQLVADATAAYANVTFEIRPPLGSHAGIIDLIVDQAALR